MAKALALLLLLVSSFTVFAEELPHTPLLHPPVATPTHYHHPLPHPHPPSPTPTPTPTPAPAHHSHHHRHTHHLHPPAPAPTPTPVVKPPTHPHYPPPTPAPAKPPTHHHYPPAPAPVKPPTHHHHYHHHHHPPTPTPTPAPPLAPVHPPVPVHPPTPTPAPPLAPLHPPVPVHPPMHPFPRSFVAVQGVVYTKSCKYAGVDTLLGATPLLGAVVKLECNNTKYRLAQTGKTDKNGYFYIEAPKTITTFGAHKCKVFLVSAPTGLKPSNLHGGVIGSPLKPEKPFMSRKLPFLLYKVGPFAFEPKCPY